MTGILQTAKDNATFLLTCFLIVTALVCLALAADKLVLKRPQRLSSTRSIAFISMFGAVAAVLMFLEFPLFFAPPFYKIDLSEIPVLICTFYLGPVAGVLCEFLKIVLKLLLKGTTTAFVGDFANFAVGCSMVLPASIVYHIRKSKKSAILGLIIGTLIMTTFGSAFNAIYLLPKFSQLYGMPLDAIVAMGTDVNASITSVSTLVLFAVVPFNVLKGIVVSLVTLLLYKRVERLLRAG
jgi:riboflavin transporter FmnP